MLKTTFVLAIVFVALLQAYIRLAPLPITHWPKGDPRTSPGDYPVPGGFHAVRVVDGPDTQAKLIEVIAQAPRTKRLASSHGAKFVVRSKFWGFPDVVRIWQEDGLLHIQSHLVFGFSDLGVNRARVQGWLDQVGV